MTRWLPGVTSLDIEGDLGARMVEGIGRYLDRLAAESPGGRVALWHRDSTGPAAYDLSVEPNRARLRHILGLADPRVAPDELELAGTAERDALLAVADRYDVLAVRWPSIEGVHGEGLWLRPKGTPRARVVAIPDADWTPEMLVGLAPGVPSEAQFARRLAESGCEVLVLSLLDRSDAESGNPLIRMTNQPHREFIYRMAFELGRHVIGYEVQKVLAAVDWLAGRPDAAPVGVIGHGEGGLLALYSAALDRRIDAACVSGYFGPREGLWQEPIYRNVFGLLREFGDAGVASLIAPRGLVVEACRGPEVDGPPAPRDGRSGAAPGRIVTPSLADVTAEVERARPWFDALGTGQRLRLVASDEGLGPPGSELALRAFLEGLDQDSAALAPPGSALEPLGPLPDPAARTKRQFAELAEATQRALRSAERDRAALWAPVSAPHTHDWQQHTATLRDKLWDDVIGRLPPASLPINPRARQTYDEPEWAGFDVVLDVWPDVFASGILLVPKDLAPGERRPVIVCQHGLEGHAADVVGPVAEKAYRDFARQLVERGYVVFAPQNPYLGEGRFRVLQRKANPLGYSLFSVIVRQHERILEWLGSLPYVDRDRIAFYGLSYGGKTAMRVPALLPGYCLSICSGDFNEWIVKNASYDQPMSYVYTGEYEMFEFDLGRTFNYAEMAALIAPRPFMVERGHDDGVSVDEWVAYEYAKVRRFYAKHGIADRTQIEFFDGGHWIHGVGTFEFLRRHLGWPTGN